MSLKMQTVSALFWKLFERGGRAVVELVVQIVMARLLAPKEFGALAIMLVFINVGNVIVQSGLNTALIQAKKTSSEDYSTVFWMSLFLAAFIYLVIYCISPFISQFYGIDNLKDPLRALALVLPIGALNSVQIALVTRELQTKKLFNATLLSVCVSGLIGVVSALQGAGLWALVAQQIAFQIVNCFVLFCQIKWRPQFVFNPRRARKLYRFGSRLLLSGLLNTVYQSLGSLIIGKRFSPVQLGYVSQGEKYPQAMGNMIDGAIQPVMLSAVSHVQDDKKAVKKLVRRALKTATFTIVPCMTIFAVVAPSLIPLLLGEKWSNCIQYMQVYCLVYALLPIHTTNLQALNGMGRSDLFLRLEVVKKIYGLFAVLFCTFVLKSMRALVFSYLITGIISTFINAAPNRRVIGYSYREQIEDIAPVFLIALVAAFAASGVTLLQVSGFALVLMQILVFFSLYLLLARLFRVETLTYLIQTLRQFVAAK